MAEIWFDAKQLEATLSGRPVISKFSLQLRLGESTTVLGPNGAGKSTLVKLIERSLYPIVTPQSHLRLFGSSTVNVGGPNCSPDTTDTNLGSAAYASVGS